MPPRAGIEITDPPERESLDVCIGGVVVCGIERYGLGIAVHRVSPAEREGRWTLEVSSEHLERPADDVFHPHTIRRE
jgi:hypothetical protein